MFNPDPKHITPKKEKRNGITHRVKEYKCVICKETYEKSTANTKRKWCDKDSCLNAYAKKVVEANRKRQEALKRKKDAEVRESLKSLSAWLNDLQKVINQIVHQLDKDLPCIARPNTRGKMNAGHYYSVGSAPNLRFHMWNIHKQSEQSNSHFSGDTHMYRMGLKIRYGEDKLNEIESLHSKYPSLNLTIDEIKNDFLPKARMILRELKKGALMTRDEINAEIGIYI